MKVSIGDYKNNKRKISVKISSHDLYSLDYTLALIISPALKKFKSASIGACNVDDKDVPKEIRSTSCKKDKKDSHIDSFWYDRFDYILDEMIWTFNEIAEDYDKEPSYLDKKESKKYDKRIKNGLRLFSKYYTSLWI